MDLTREMAADAAAEAARLPDDETLRRVATLATEQVALEHEVARLEEELDTNRKRLDELRDKALSDLLMGLGLRALKLCNGQSVTVRRLVFASIKAENQPTALAWLRSHGFAALIKEKLELDAGKGAAEKLAELKKFANFLQVDVVERSGVHPQTLKAFVAEQLEKGSDIPRDLFGIYEINRTVIK